MSRRIKCMLIEDEPPARAVILAYVNQTPFLELCEVATNAFEANELIKSINPDLVFLDVNLPQLDGLSWLRMQEEKVPNVIMTTADPNYALMGYELGVVDYLLKPIRYSRFERAVLKVLDKMHLPIPTHLVIETGRTSHRLAYDTILYIESDDDTTLIHTTLPEQIYKLRTRLQDIADQLSSPPFFRVNRSFIVNLAYVQSVNLTSVVLNGGKQISIGSKYKDNATELLRQFQYL